MTTIAQLLREKGHAVFSIGPDETVYQAESCSDMIPTTFSVYKDNQTTDIRFRHLLQ